jgi:hypothetical protein
MRFGVSLSFLVLVMVYLLGSKAQASAPQNIKILEASGEIADSSQPLKITKWSRNSRVVDRLSLSLGEKSHTKIQLHPQVILKAYGNTDFEIPNISWETRQFKEINLTKGSLRIEVNKVPFEIYLSSPFFKVLLPQGIWVFSIDPKKGTGDILALNGNLEVASLNSQDKVSLKTGDRVTFQGLVEEGEIAYDLLLEGRKIPKGKWLPVANLTSVDNQNFSIEAERRKKAAEEKFRALKMKEEIKKRAKNLCLKPPGNFRECLWKVEKKQCLRSRCAADGKWKDSQVVPSTFCDKKAGWTPEPKACDY